MIFGTLITILLALPIFMKHSMYATTITIRISILGIELPDLLGFRLSRNLFLDLVIPIIEDLLYIYIHMHAIHKTGVDADEGTYVDLNPSLEMSMNSCISVIF